MHVIPIILNGSVKTITAGIRQIYRYGPKSVYAIDQSTAGLPKGSNTHGNGVSIVGNGLSQPITKVRQRMYSTSTLAVGGKSFNGGDLLSKMKVRGGKYTGLYNLIMTEELLFAAYHRIKSKPGNMTPGTDELTLDGFSRQVVRNITEKLKSEKFQFKPSQIKFIPKANGKMRPLGIPSTRDKVVQMAIVILLELIYEQHFLESNHGFRPKRGCHTAMAKINQ